MASESRFIALFSDTRNGLFWCYKHKDWKPNSCSQYELCQTFFDKVYSKNLVKKPVKVKQKLFTISCVMLFLLITFQLDIFCLRYFYILWNLPIILLVRNIFATHR